MAENKIPSQAAAAAAAIKDLEKNINDLTIALAKETEGTKKWEAANKRLTKAIGIQTAAVKKEAASHDNSTNAINREIRAQRALLGTLDQSSKEYAEVSASIRTYEQSMGTASASTGLASTSALEFGRVISDAPYGIRGMANNVSQLTTLLFQGAGQISATTGKVIGLKGAIKGMWGAIMGPLGIMIAIQAVIAALDYFVGGTEKAEESTNNLKGTVEELAGALDNLYLSEDQVGERIDEFTKLQDLKAKLLKEEMKNNEEHEESAENKASAEKWRDIALTTAKEETSKVRAENATKEAARLQLIVEKEEANMKRLVSIDYANTVRIQEAEETLKRATEGTVKALNNEMSVLKEKQKAYSKDHYVYDYWADKILEKQAEIDAITGIKKTKGKQAKKVKAFVNHESKMLSMLSGFLREQEMLLAKSDAEKLRLTNEYAIEDLIIVRETEKAKELIRLNAYLNSKASPEQKAAAKAAYDAAEIENEKTHGEALIQLGYTAFLKENQLIEDTKQAFSEQSIQKEIEREQNRLTVLEEALGNSPESLAVLEQQQRLIWEKEDEFFETDLERRREELFAIYDSETQVEDIINAEKDERDRVRAEGEIKLEQDKADAKVAIQLEYLNYVKGFGNVLSILGKKNKALAVVGLAVEKGSAIASIIVKASAVNAKAAAASLEFASVTTAANAYMGPAGAALSTKMIAANEAATAAGKAKTNITAGISIAKIAATSLTSSALGGSGGESSSGGGSGGGSTSFTPNFNVVGNSNENQLAEGISQQVNQTVRAVVVYDDISEAGNIVNDSIDQAGI